MDSVRPEDVGSPQLACSALIAPSSAWSTPGKIAGAVSLVARQGKVAHVAATGMMDREAGRAMERDTIFRIASMTKLITVTATLMLFEEGHFLLDDPIAEFPTGIRDDEGLRPRDSYRDRGRGPGASDYHPPPSHPYLGPRVWLYRGRTSCADLCPRKGWPTGRPLADVVRQLAAVPLAHQPGERLTYGLSHDVLGRLVEVISGQTLDAFLQERVFDPLEMVDTGFAVPSNAGRRLATVYVADGRGNLKPDLTDVDRSIPPAFLSGGGGWSRPPPTTLASAKCTSTVACWAMRDCSVVRPSSSWRQTSGPRAKARFRQDFPS